jgi:nicotinamidase-related amidase
LLPAAGQATPAPMPSQPQPLKVRTPRRPKADTGDRGTLPHSPTVLLLVDVINPFEFPEAKALAPAAWQAARAVARLKARLAAQRVLTIYANDNYGQWRSDFRQTLEHCLACGGVAAQIAQLLAPAPADLVMLKPRHSAFYATPLDLVLTQVQAKQLVIGGLAADICVQLSAMDAVLRGYQVVVPSDCTAAETPAAKAQALAYMKRVLKADVRRSTLVAPKQEKAPQRPSASRK